MSSAINPGGVMKLPHARPAHARPAHAPPGPAKGVNPGGVMKAAPGPRAVNPGGPMKKAKKASHAKKAKKIRRGLARITDPGGWVLGGNDVHDTCAAAAIANSLLLATGIRAADEEIIAFGEGLDLEDALELAAERGLGGVRLAWFEPASLGETWAGLILGIGLPGPHAVLALGDDWVTWGRRCAIDAFPGAVAEEAWALCWEPA